MCVCHCVFPPFYDTRIEHPMALKQERVVRNSTKFNKNIKVRMDVLVGNKLKIKKKNVS